MTYIYALCEPGTRSVRYIGKTTNLKKRLVQHLRQSITESSPLGDWLRSLSGATPNMVTLCETSGVFWQDDEATYIRSARALGMPLVNSTDGGEGVAFTPEIRAKISAGRKGKRAGKDHQNFGKRLSPETCARISASKTGKKRSKKTCAAMSAGAKLTWANPEARAKYMAAAKARRTKENLTDNQQ